MPNRKHVMAIDLILVVGTFLVIAVLLGYYNYSLQPVLLSPQDELVTTSTSVLFEFGEGNLILIDDNPEFTSPEKIYAQDNLIVNLKPGKYYWQVQGEVSSEIREFTIETEVDLKLRKAGESYFVVNAGNTLLNVEVYEKGEYVESVVLDVDESKEVSGTKFIGGQDE